MTQSAKAWMLGLFVVGGGLAACGAERVSEPSVRASVVGSTDTRASLSRPLLPNRWATRQSNRWGEPPIVPEYEIPNELLNGGHSPPVGFDSIAGLNQRDALLPVVSAVSANLQLEIVDGSDPRSEHIKQACSGEQSAYNHAVVAFVGSSLWTVGAAFFRNVGQAWNGLRASAAALSTVNVARAVYNGCAYREGRAWDDAH